MDEERDEKEEGKMRRDGDEVEEHGDDEVEEDMTMKLKKANTKVDTMMK